MGAAVAVIAAMECYKEEEINRIYIPREPRINAIAQREFYIDSILNRGDRHCVEQIRMKPIVLHRLCDLLTSRNLLRATQNVSIREQVIVFLQIVGHNQRFRVVIISPFHGVRYHLNEFTDRAPENEKELFNLRHSSLRTVIERGFGI
ncbi:nuclease HARBI [Salix suchowensis]|nr:nuclease HARBI [Salix suchowensis]